MKRLLILSGKGDAGKTTTAATFIRFAQAKAIADCDVDAPKAALAIIDGSPGTGYPVIESVSGMDLVLAVSETSFSPLVPFVISTSMPTNMTAVIIKTVNNGIL